MTSIFGLPAHPFFAHIPVVLIPLGALGAVAMLWPRVRDRIGWWVVALVLVAGLSTQLAISSGKSLRRYVPETALVRAHTHLGENIRPWVLLMFLSLVGVMLLARRGGRRAAVVVVASLSIAFSAVSVYWIYRIGHSGSKAVWAKTQTRIDHGLTNERGGENGR